MNKENLTEQFNNLCKILISEQNEQQFWTGRLASSALATSGAIVAFKKLDPVHFDIEINKGLEWLLHNINKDGGFGDTPESKSNISTTLLCYAAIFYCQNNNLEAKKRIEDIENYLVSKGINLNPHQLAKSILSYYGKDRSFSVPIVSMLAICGVLGDKGYDNVPQLPFELAILPNSFYKFVNLQVVSYALPALVAEGIACYKNRKNKNIFLWPVRKLSIPIAIRKLEKMIPDSGGFLEAIPLTAFVCMCLIESGYKGINVVSKGISFLTSGQRRDGSWPIDTDLSSWVTTLAIKGLGKSVYAILGDESTTIIRSHLLNLQFKKVHPFNKAKPGGWGWTSYAGSVPDADDTPGAILALLQLYKGTDSEVKAIIDGCNWLVNVQNRDGGLPTFCKGWGKLPFDQSCTDLTGHAFNAIIKSIYILGDKIDQYERQKLLKASSRMIGYLKDKQTADGYWLPLWFGNQYHTNERNPVYGTAKVCTYLVNTIEFIPQTDKLKVTILKMISNARSFLISNQNDDGSWGGMKNISGTIEETSLAISALTGSDNSACIKGFEWLNNEFQKKGIYSSPIGLYFASLWYDERLYPLIFYIEALQRYLQIQ